jgi:hypothetical protein
VPESGKPIPLAFYVPCAKSIAPLCLTALPSASVEPPYRMRGTDRALCPDWSPPIAIDFLLNSEDCAGIADHSARNGRLSPLRSNPMGRHERLKSEDPNGLV